MLILRPIQDALDIEAMRLCRNACREYMTRGSDEISQSQQQAWWSRMTSTDPDFSTWRPFLAWDGSTVIGYGIVWHGAHVLRDPNPALPGAERQAWLTGGLLPQFRGRGDGRWLFERLVEHARAFCGLPCWLEVRLDNYRARSLYARLGFVEVTRLNRNGVAIAVMKYAGEMLPHAA